MKVLSTIVGIALLGASLVLAYLSSSNSAQMIKNKNAIVMKYVEQSTKALEEEDIKGAIKAAKLAIAADPKNKAGFKAYEDAIEAKYKPNEESQDESTNEQPSEDEEEEEDMGC